MTSPPPTTPAHVSSSNQRVRLFVSIRNRPEELDAVEAAITALGWTLRVEPASVPAQERVDAVAEARFPGSRYGGRSRAGRELAAVILDQGLDVRLDRVYTTRVHQPQQIKYKIAYTPSAAHTMEGRVERALAALGYWNIGEIYLPPGTTQADWPAHEARFRADTDIEPGRVLRTVPPLPDPAAPPVTPPAVTTGGRALLVVAGLALVGAAFLTGVALSNADGLRLIPPAIVAAAVGALSGMYGSRVPGVGPMWRGALGAALVAIFIAAIGYTAYGHTPVHRAALQATVVILVVGLVRGWYLLVRRSTLRQGLIVVLITVLLPVLLPWTPMIGDAGHTAYLDDFGLAPADLRIAGVWRVILTLRAFGYATLVAAVIGSLMGWIRHFNALDRWNLVIFSTLLVVLYAVTVLATLTDTASDGVARLRAAAAAGRPLPHFYGITPRPVCVVPLADKVPYVGFPPPPDHPVVGFDDQGDYVRLWDPVKRANFSVRKEDVGIVVVAGIRSACPPVPAIVPK